MSRPVLLLLIALSVLVVIACSGGGDPGVTPPPTTPHQTAERWLQLWKDGKYDDMYQLVSANAAAKISQKDFADRYAAIFDEAKLTGLDYEIRTSAEQATKIDFAVTFHSSFFADFPEVNTIPLVQDSAASGFGQPQRLPTFERLEGELDAIAFLQRDQRRRPRPLLHQGPPSRQHLRPLRRRAGRRRGPAGGGHRAGPGDGQRGGDLGPDSGPGHARRRRPRGREHDAALVLLHPGEDAAVRDPGRPGAEVPRHGLARRRGAVQDDAASTPTATRWPTCSAT